MAHAGILCIRLIYYRYRDGTDQPNDEETTIRIHEDDCEINVYSSFA